MYFIAVAPIKYICKQKGELNADFIYMYPFIYIKAKVMFFFQMDNSLPGETDTVTSFIYA